MNTEFVGMKRPIILRDELSVKHEEQRKKSPQKFVPILTDQTIDNLDTNEADNDDEVLFIDVQNGKCLYIFISIFCFFYCFIRKIK